MVGPELLLTITMAARATSSLIRANNYSATQGSYGATQAPDGRYSLWSTNGTPVGIGAIGEEIDRVVSDEDMFEGPDEPRPTNQTIARAKALLAAVNGGMAGSFIPSCRVSPYYGELDFTWNRDNRLLRLMVFSDDRPPLLYWQTDGGETLTLGDSREASNPEQIVERLKWLLG
jgi:hypothetical protein